MAGRGGGGRRILAAAVPKSGDAGRAPAHLGSVHAIPASCAARSLRHWSSRAAPASSAASHPIVDRVYHCTLIARAQDLAPLGASGTPSINAFGQVAFAAATELPSESEIRVGWGDAFDGVPQTRLVARGNLAGGAPFLPVWAASIENSGRVVYPRRGLPAVRARQRRLPRALRRVGGSLAPTPLVERLNRVRRAPSPRFTDCRSRTPSDVSLRRLLPTSDGAPPQRTGLFRSDTAGARPLRDPRPPVRRTSTRTTPDASRCAYAYLARRRGATRTIDVAAVPAHAADRFRAERDRPGSAASRSHRTSSGMRVVWSLPWRRASRSASGPAVSAGVRRLRRRCVVRGSNSPGCRPSPPRSIHYGEVALVAVDGSCSVRVASSWRTAT